MVSPMVTIKQGQLRGIINKDLHEKEYYSFKGIPYGKPPIGPLRFKAPLPADAWTGVLNATIEGNVCYQVDEFKNILVGSEDCLYLNIYTKNISQHDELNPVMFFIHGGGFNVGSGDSSMYGPEYLITENVVLVTINYRLGILGFLSFEDSSVGVPGNAGLKDIVLALRWVQNNISSFGGDPNNVTIFGQSAGAAAVHYLVLSPMADGLFHKAILQSGVALNPLAQGRHLSTAALEKCGIHERDAKMVLEYLKEMPVQQLLKLQIQLTDMLDPNALRYLAPVVEDNTSEVAFLSDYPLNIIKSGNYNRVPLIFGYTSEEGMLVELLRNDPRLSIFQHTKAQIPFYLNIKEDTEDHKFVIEQIEDFYLENRNSTNAKPENIYKLSTDTMFLCGIMKALKTHLTTLKCPIFLYKITVESSLNIMKHLAKIQTSGVCHGDDIGYLFKTFLSTDKIILGSTEDELIKSFVKLWSNFARYGDPTPNRKTTYLEITWPPVQINSIRYLEIGKTLRIIKSEPETERMDFWSRKFQKSPSKI